MLGIRIFLGVCVSKNEASTCGGVSVSNKKRFLDIRHAKTKFIFISSKATTYRRIYTVFLISTVGHHTNCVWIFLFSTTTWPIHFNEIFFVCLHRSCEQTFTHRHPKLWYYFSGGRLCDWAVCAYEENIIYFRFFSYLIGMKSRIFMMVPFFSLPVQYDGFFVFTLFFLFLILDSLLFFSFGSILTSFKAQSCSIQRTKPLSNYVLDSWLLTIR